MWQLQQQNVAQTDTGMSDWSQHTATAWWPDHYAEPPNRNVTQMQCSVCASGLLPACRAVAVEVCGVPVADVHITAVS